MRESLKNAAVLGVSSLVALGGIELGLRYIGNDLALGNQYAFYRFDPKLGWTNTPDESGFYLRGEFSYPVKNNSLGMRDADVGEKKPDEKRVAVLGDSFTWGVGAADGQRFTEIVEAQNPGFNVLNFGVSGYGTVQHAIQLDEVLSLRPDAVVVAFCLGNDFLDNVMPFRYGYHKPTADLDEAGALSIAGYPLYESKSFGGALSGALSNFRIVGLIRQFFRRQDEKKWMAENAGSVEYTIGDSEMYLPDAALSPEKRIERQKIFDVAVGLLKQMNDKVEAAIGPDRFQVLFVPTKFEVGIAKQQRAEADRDYVARELKARLDAAAVPVVDGREVIGPEDFWARDGHWNPQGHLKIGKLLASDLATRLQ